MTNRNEFLSNTSDVISGLERALRELTSKKTDTTNYLNGLRSKRESALRSHVEELLPNLERETLLDLRTLLPGFVASSVTSVFDEASMLHVPLLTRLFGNPANYRTHEFAAEFNMLRTRLAAAIDGLDPKPQQFEDIRTIDAEFVQLQEKAHALAGQEAHVQDQLTALKRAHTAFSQNQDLRIPRNLAGAVRESATKLREQPRSATPSRSTQDHDAYSDILIYWATGIPTSLRTFAFYAIAGHNNLANATEEFVPGGGQMGGGGASGEFQESNKPITADSNPTIIIAGDDRGHS